MKNDIIILSIIKLIMVIVGILSSSIYLLAFIILISVLVDLIIVLRKN